MSDDSGPPKGDIHLTYRVHGSGLSSLVEGFSHIGMPEHRRKEATAIISEILDANGVGVFRWYKTDSLNELCCYWDDAAANMMWVGPGQIHIKSTTPRPSRAITWTKAGGNEVGWLLPGAVAGSGGGPATTVVASKVLCPDSGVLIPVGTLCPYCDEAHQ